MEGRVRSFAEAAAAHVDAADPGPDEGGDQVEAAGGGDGLSEDALPCKTPKASFVVSCSLVGNLHPVSSIGLQRETTLAMGMSFKSIHVLAAGLALAASSALAHAEAGAPALRFDAPALTLEGPAARLQLVLTDEIGARDLTRAVAYESAPANLLSIDATGWVKPLHDGVATVTAHEKEGAHRSASIQITVRHAQDNVPVHFANDVVPLFTKNGCNSGGCHGRASGQNGFKLSLFGYEAMEDYDHLVKEARGRRVFPAAPERSLLLLKATNLVPHNGGNRLVVGSDDYNLILRWIRQGLPAGTLSPALTGIDVYPKERILEKHALQQLAVQAHYSDGSTRDVTRTAIYDAVDKAMAEVSSDGLVTLSDLPGDAAVMVRYQGQVAVFRAAIPLGQPLAQLPPTNNYVDEHVFAKLKTLGIPPSPLCDDSTFLRRVSLDIAGRLPTLEETRAFLQDTTADKRNKAIDRLLDTDDYAEFFAGKWSAMLKNRRSENTYERGCYVFYQWIRDSFAANKPYDQFAREVLTASGDIVHTPPVAWYRQFKEANLQMEDVAQIFLGTRLQCAQCHHHPYEKWSQRDYLALSAFFSQVARKPSGVVAEEIVVHKRGVPSVLNKKTKEQVKPCALGAKAPTLSAEDDPRQTLADWMVDPQNPFFAKALVNRYWKHFFGRGLVEPEDDIRDTNPPSNPALFEALTKDFEAHHYDMKQLIRTLTRSRAYQLSASPVQGNIADRQNFSRYYPKRLMAEVLFDAVNTVVKSQTNFKDLAIGTRAVALPDNSFNAGSYFLTVFGRPDSSSACECERTMEASLAQSLHLLNADEIQNKLASSSGRAALLAKDTRSDADKVKEIYLMAVSREPETDELANATAYLTKKVEGVPSGELPQAKQKAWEDLLWVVINTKEFLFNH